MSSHIPLKDAPSYLTKDRIKDAPRRDADGSLRVNEENRLYEYYGLSVSSEERLVVGTETHDSGRVRLHKYVVTKTVAQPVP